MKKSNLLIVILLLSYIITSCRKDDFVPPTPKKPRSMNELVASSTFNWKTTRDYQITIKGFYNDVIRIVSANGIVYHKGFMKANTDYIVKLSLPSYETKIHFIYFGKDIEYTLNQSVVNYTFSNK